MSDTKEKQLEIRFVGDNIKLRRRIRRVVVSTKMKHSTLAEFKISILPNLMKYLLVIDIGSLPAEKDEALTKWSNQLAGASPLLYFSEGNRMNSSWIKLYAKLYERIGATVFVGESGQKLLLSWLEQTAQRDPAEIITSWRCSDSGLTIAFADDATASISFADLKRIAETPEIVLNDIRIAGDRSYIMVGTKGGYVPIPFDILREYVQSDKSERQKKNLEQRRLTARNVGVRIRKLREGSSISQEKLATLTKTSRWTIMRIEKGEYLPKISIIERIAHALHLDLERLLVT